jgi:integrase
VPRLPTSDGRSLTVDETQRLLDEVRQERLGVAITIMLTMGLRPGEAFGLGWQHIDFDSHRLDVRRSLKREPDGLRLGEVKTKNSRRSLQMPQLVIDRLQAHRRAQNKERMAAAEWQDPDLVFPTSQGTLIDPRNFRRSFDKLTDRAGLGKWTPNELRHSAVSLLSAAGVPIEEIADVVGHDGTRMTTGVYRHVLRPGCQCRSSADGRPLPVTPDGPGGKGLRVRRWGWFQSPTIRRGGGQTDRSPGRFGSPRLSTWLSNPNTTAQNVQDPG